MTDVQRKAPLSEDELGFLKRIAGSEGGKHAGDPCHDARGSALWPRLERDGLIQCVGTYKWVATPAGRTLLAGLELPVLNVWVGPMPETNGKSNFTVMLYSNQDMFGGICVYRSEYPGRADYEADKFRHLLGLLKEEPCILNYDTDKHSGYTPPTGHRAGDTFQREEEGMWTAGIDLMQADGMYHFQAINCYGATREEAESRRDTVLHHLTAHAAPLQSIATQGPDEWTLACGHHTDECVAIHGAGGHIASGLTPETGKAIIDAHNNWKSKTYRTIKASGVAE